MFGLLLLPLAMTAGVGADYTIIIKERAALQDLADGAALRAVRSHMLTGRSEAELEAEAAIALGLPVQTNPSQPASVDIALGGEGVVTATVTLQKQVDLLFGGFYGKDGRATIKVAANAGESGATPVSLLLLAPSSAAWQASGGSQVTLENGAARVNSGSASALQGSGGASVEAAGTFVAGPAAAAPNWKPAPVFGVRPMTDPFAKLPWPTVTGCDHVDRVVKNETVSLQPGVYCGGLDLQTHGVADLQPGLYVLDGSLRLSAHAVLNAPADVTIVLVGASSYVEARSGSELKVVAPRTGPWANVAIAQKPQSTERESTLIGGGELKLDGVIYLPTQKLVVTGGGSADFDGARIVVAARLHTKGNGHVVLRGDEAILAMPGGARLLN